MPQLSDEDEDNGQRLTATIYGHECFWKRQKKHRDVWKYNTIKNAIIAKTENCFIKGVLYSYAW